MALTNPKDIVTEERLAEFYQQILPYLGGASHTLVGGAQPVGSIIPFMGITAPSGTLACDGTVYNITDYPDLANFFDAQFGEINHFGGDGTTTFAVPNLNGEFLRGTGTNSHTLGGVGASVGTHQEPTIHQKYCLGGKTNTLYIYTDSEHEADEWINNSNNFDAYTISTKSKSIATQGWINNTTNEGYFTSRPTNTSVLWCIQAVAGDYSLDEKVVGRWIDKKPIYQKTIDFGALPNSDRKSVAHNVSNMEKVINITGFAQGPSSIIPVPTVNPNASNDGSAAIYVNSSDIVIRTRADLTVFFSAYITIQYTKTTDV